MVEQLCKYCHNLMKPMSGGILNYDENKPLQEHDEYIEYECPLCNLRRREETKVKWFRN